MRNALGALAVIGAVILFMYCAIYAGAKLALWAIRYCDRKDAEARERARQDAGMRDVAIRAPRYE